MAHTQESAEVLGLKVLGWLATHEELLPVFLGSTGASSEDLRAGTRDAAFLGAVLDFLLMDDAWVIQAGDALGVGYDQIYLARQALPGGEQVHWT